MELKTKNFLWGAVVGIVLIIALIIGLFTYLYYRGTAISEEKIVQQQKEEAEQIQRFNATCQNVIPDVMVYLHKTLTPALNVSLEGRPDKEALIALVPGIHNKAEFLGHCATRVAFRDENSLKRSNQLMYAYEVLSTVDIHLDALAISKCDIWCQRDLVQRATKASAKVENILLGNEHR